MINFFINRIILYKNNVIHPVKRNFVGGLLQGFTSIISRENNGNYFIFNYLKNVY
jgi:nucleoside permease NupC